MVDFYGFHVGKYTIHGAYGWCLMWDPVDCGSVKRVAVDFVSQGTLVVSNCPQISDTRFGVEVRFLLFIFPGSQADYQNNRNPNFWRWEDSLLNENSRLGENDFWYFHPYLGNWSNLTSIFFRWVGSKPPTRNPVFFLSYLFFRHVSCSPPNKRSVLIVHPIITLDSQSKIIQKNHLP